MAHNRLYVKTEKGQRVYARVQLYEDTTESQAEATSVTSDEETDNAENTTSTEV